MSLLSTLLESGVSLNVSNLSSVANGDALLNVEGSLGSDGGSVSMTSITNVASSVLPSSSVDV